MASRVSSSSPSSVVDVEGEKVVESLVIEEEERECDGESGNETAIEVEQVLVADRRRTTASCSVSRRTRYF